MAKNIVIELRKALEQATLQISAQTRQIKDLSKDQKNLLDRVKKAETEVLDSQASVVAIKKTSDLSDAQKKLDLVRTSNAALRIKVREIDNFIFTLRSFSMGLSNILSLQDRQITELKSLLDKKR